VVSIIVVKFKITATESRRAQGMAGRKKAGPEGVPGRLVRASGGGEA